MAESFFPLEQQVFERTIYQRALLLLGFDRGQQLPQVRGQLAEPFTVQLWDAKGDATGKWDVPATSYVVVLDKAGKVVYTGVGGSQDLESAIRKAL